MNNYHTSVLLHEIREFLNITPDAKYIDATLGGGGHTAEIINQGGRVLGIDTDEEAISYVTSRYQSHITTHKLSVVYGNFKDIKKIAGENGFDKVAGIIFDLGVSSHQLDTPERGFSFRHVSELDMRMDSKLGVKAKDLLNVVGKNELYELFFKMGEEPFSRPIANGIIKSRALEPIHTTQQLSKIIDDTVPGKYRSDAKVRIYQALRIAVNDELNNITHALPKAFGLLDKGGKLAVISFHSLEDRIVKNYFAGIQAGGTGTILTKKPVTPTDEEVKENNRARSAKLRVIQKNL